MYDSVRKGLRVDCGDRCFLHHNGEKYSCTLENLSISGALVWARDFPPPALRKGDHCGLLLCSDPEVCPGEFTSEVTRLEPSRVALHFLDIAL